MRFGIKTVALVTILTLHAITPVQAMPNLTGYPNSMAATGDSITRAYNTGTLPFSDAAGNSWSTGTRASVESHYTRILVAQPAILGRNYHHAVTGAKMAGLDSQMQQVNDQAVAYVTILMGANDLCTRGVAEMTSVADFRSPVRTCHGYALRRLPPSSHLCREHPRRLPAVGHLEGQSPGSFGLADLDICQSLLQHPRSTDASDVMRRLTVRQRNIDFNVQLTEVCAMYIHCRLDQNAIFSDPFRARGRLEARLLPSLAPGSTAPGPGGVERDLRLFDQIPPLTTASTAVVEGGILVSLEATDDVGVAGIEYRLNLGAFQRYVGPFVLTTGSNIRFRAVDVNGNIETTQSLAA